MLATARHVGPSAPVFERFKAVPLTHWVVWAKLSVVGWGLPSNRAAQFQTCSSLGSGHINGTYLRFGRCDHKFCIERLVEWLSGNEQHTTSRVVNFSSMMERSICKRLSVSQLAVFGSKRRIHKDRIRLPILRYDDICLLNWTGVHLRSHGLSALSRPCFRVKRYFLAVLSRTPSIVRFLVHVA